MPMRVLIVDDSLTIRSMLRRAIVEASDAEVGEASNGIEALAELGRQTYDLVVLDLTMPVMDGVETLEAIRGTPALSAVPVVMLSGEKSEVLVRRVVELGITDFLTKPLSRQQLSERLSRVFQRLVDPVGVETAPAEEAPAGPRAPVLVVEKNAEFRQFLVTALGPHYEVTAVDSGALALMKCLEPREPPFRFVVTAKRVDPPPLEMFVAKLRSLPTAKGMPIFAVLPRLEARSGEFVRLFDGVVDRTYMPDLLLSQVERLVGADTPARKVSRVRPTLEKDTIAATEQLFGLMVAAEVEACPFDPARFVWPGTGLHASIGLRSEADAFHLTLLLRASTESARIISAQMIGVGPGDVSDEDLLASGAEIVNIIAGRLRNRLIESDINVAHLLPETWIGPTPETAPRGEAAGAFAIAFDAATLGCTFELTVLAGTV